MPDLRQASALPSPKRAAPVSAQVLAYTMITLLLSWPSWLATLRNWIPLTPFGSFAPSLAALLLTGYWSGRTGLGGLLRGLVRWRAPVGVWAVALLGPFVAHAAAVVLTSGLAGLRPAPSPLPSYLLPLVPLEILVLGGPLGEELGWRGFALPRLLEIGGPMRASLIVAVMWIVWHVPLFWIPGSGQAEIPFLYFALTLAAYSVVLTWLYLKSSRSLLIAVLFHTSANTAYWFAQAFFSPSLSAPAYGKSFVGLALAGAVLAAVALRRSLQQAP